MNAEKIAAAFDFGTPVFHVEECRIGHINSTFFVNTPKGKFVVQRINTNIFKNPAAVLHNAVGVTEHIRRKLQAAGVDSADRALQFAPVKNGEGYIYIDEDKGNWRAYRYVEGNNYQSCDSPALFRRVGFAFGSFQRQLSDYDASSLLEVIPQFHDTAKRYRDFEEAVAADVCGRAADVAEEIAFVRARAAGCSLIVAGIATGKFPLRVTHNDTKLNNVIMDSVTGEGKCVIDLDTVMPGSLLYDFGDAIRFGASTAAEDETDLSLVGVDPVMFEAYTEGFLSAIGDAITTAELLALPEGARLMTLECGMRFLADHLAGDIYFRIGHEGHNLERARNQFKLVADIEEKMPLLLAIVKKYLT